jgi:hypothetical protein
MQINNKGAVNKLTMKYVIFILCIFFLLSPKNAFSLRCGSDLVSRGDRKIEVLKKCGEPDLIETWEEEITIHVKGLKDEVNRDSIIERAHGFSENTISHVEEWTYNFGPQRFIQFLTFVNGKLLRIEEGPRGFYGEILSDSYKKRCGQLVEAGDRKIEVIKKCGDPYAIDYLWEVRVSRATSKERIRKIPRFLKGKRGRNIKDYIFKKEKVHEETKELINIEEWIYNFGPRKFLYFITLENGRVVKIEEGDYGF